MPAHDLADLARSRLLKRPPSSYLFHRSLSLSVPTLASLRWFLSLLRSQQVWTSSLLCCPAAGALGSGAHPRSPSRAPLYSAVFSSLEAFLSFSLRVLSLSSLFSHPLSCTSLTPTIPLHTLTWYQSQRLPECCRSRRVWSRSVGRRFRREEEEVLLAVFLLQLAVFLLQSIPFGF